MLLPLFYYLVGFFVYVLLFEYYRHNLRKRVAQLDFIQHLDDVKVNDAVKANLKPFDRIKSEILSHFYFDRMRIIFGIDLSASNEWQGRRTFNRQSLHKTQANKIFNPYQRIISQLGPTFEDFFASKLEYSCFGFGDQDTKDYAFFPIAATGEAFANHRSILEAYLEQTKNVTLSGPTAFLPIMRKLISYGIHCPKDFTMLILVTDEPKISHQDAAFVDAIRTLAFLPNTCLIVIGVGDGPWDRLSYEEHCLRELVLKKMGKKQDDLTRLIASKHCFDNFHFIHYDSIVFETDRSANENSLARALFTKVPNQLKKAFLHDQNNAHF